MNRTALIVALLLVWTTWYGNAATIYSQGFNDATVPSGWSAEVVNHPSGPAPAITFVTNSIHPAGFGPYEGTRFACFNSWTCVGGSSVRLKLTNSFATLGYAGVAVQFAWTRDTQYYDSDYMKLQFSTNGTTWVDAGTYNRSTDASSNFWQVQTCLLPAAALNQPKVYFAFLFVSGWGNDCHLDDLRIQSLESAPPGNFTAAPLASDRIALAWTLNANGQPVFIASNGVNSFGAPISGTVYNVGSALPGGGGIIYKGTGTSLIHTGLTPDSPYYYRAWSASTALFYSASVAARARTFAPTIVSLPHTESFESGWEHFQQSEEFDFTWQRKRGPVLNVFTGPSGAYDGEWYAHLDASYPHNPNKTAAMQAAVSFAGISHPTLSFYYHLFGSTMGTLAVDVFDGVWHTGVWSITGQQQTSKGAPWRQAEVSLLPYAQSNVAIRFRGVTGSGSRSDMGVDAVRFFNKPPNLYLWPDVSHASGLSGSQVAYTLTLENATPAAHVCVFSWDSAWPVNGPIATTAAIPSGSSTALVFTVTVPPGTIAGDVCTTMVRTISADAHYTNAAQLITRATWSADAFDESFEFWPHGWTNYTTAGATAWFQDTLNGHPAPPCAVHVKDTVVGAASWLVSPPIDLSSPGAERALCSFFYLATDAVSNEGLYVSAGNRDPLSGDYEKVADFVWESGPWTRSTYDISKYLGKNQIYLGFLYRAPNPPQGIDTVSIVTERLGIDSARLVAPASFVMDSYQASPAIIGELFIAGETGADGPAQNITAQFGCGPAGTPPHTGWTWVDAPYLGSNGSNDVFSVNSQITVAGSLDYAYRFRRGDAAWVYADLDGSSNGYQSGKAGKATVTMLPPKGALLIDQPIEPAFVNQNDAYAWPTNTEKAYYETADDFSLPYDAHIKSLRWAGAYSEDGRQGNERGFTVRFYSASTGAPAALLFQQFTPGYACEQVLGGINRFKYHCDLPFPFLMQAGQRYWLSIQAEAAPYTGWQLALRSGGVGQPAMARISTTSEWEALPQDMSVEVYGTATNAGVVTGIVTAQHSGNPLPGAEIWITNSLRTLTTTAAANGSYTLTMPVGTYTVIVSAPNYVTSETANVVVPAGGTVTHNVALIGSVLTYGPAAITERMQFGDRVTNTVSVTNSGPSAVSYFVTIDNSRAQTNFALTALRAVQLPRFEGVIAQTPAQLGLPPQAERPAVRGATLALPAAYPNVLCYGFDAMPTPNRLLLFMSSAPNDILTNLPTVGNGSDFVTGTDFLGNDLNTLYGITYLSGVFFKVSVANAAATIIATVTPPAGQYWTGMTASPDNQLYICSSDVITSRLYAINPANGALTFIGVISNCPGAIDIAVNRYGEMYAVDIVDDNLVRIDRATGAGTIVGSIGFNANLAQGMDFDDVNDILYLAAYENGAGRQLRAADIVTGNTTNLGPMNEVIAGFAIAAPSRVWLTLSTNTGSMASGGVSSFDVVFDASAVSNVGSYHADLTFHGTYVNNPPPLPLTMIIGSTPIISAPTLVTFPDTLIGDVATQSFSIANIGVDVLTGIIAGVHLPFSVGPTNYIVPAGTNVTVTALFAPIIEGIETNVLKLSGGGGTYVTLRGDGVPEPAMLAALALCLAAGIRRRLG